MSLSQLVESYKFWDVVTLWAKEKLEHEDIVAKPGYSVAVLCTEALEHILAIVRTAKKDSRKILKDEFVLKADFRNRVTETGQSLPSFWFSEDV